MSGKQIAGVWHSQHASVSLLTCGCDGTIPLCYSERADWVSYACFEVKVPMGEGLWEVGL